MGVILASGYTVPGGDQPITHARIAHSGNWFGAAATASTTATDYYADGPLNSLTYEKWQPSTLPATWQASFDGGSQAFDYCLIAAHNMGTNGNTLEVQQSAGGWTDIITATAITDNMPILCIFDKTDSAARIRITNGTAPSIGVIKFGVALQMPRPIYGGHGPIHLAPQPTMRSVISETGEFLGKTKLRATRSSDFAWQHLTAAWVRTNWPGFQTALQNDPFAIAWRPGDFSEVAYGQTTDIPAPSNMGIRDLMAVSLSMSALDY